MTELAGQEDAYNQGYAKAQRDHAKRHINVCALLGEAHGMLEGLLCSVTFQDDEHRSIATANVKKWVEKMNKFVENEK